MSSQKKITFIAPFDLKRLTGTPIRASITIDAAKKLGDIYVIESRGLKFFSFCKRTITALRKEKPDSIHGFTTLSIAPALLYKFFFNGRVIIIFEMHGWAWFETKGQNFFKRLAFLLIDILGLWFSNKIIAMSNTEKKFLSKLVYRPEKIFVLWGPVEIVPEYKSPSNKNVVVGYLGNDSWWQGIDVLVSAAKTLSGEDAVFKLAGFNSSDKKRFPKIDNVEYVGRVERKNVMGFLQSCNLLISPRLDTMASNLQFPHKLSEYMAAGRPVVVSSVSDQKEIVMSAECGFTLNKIDAASIVKAIKRFTTLSEGDEKKLGENAAKFAKENFLVDSFKEKLKMVYSQNK